MTEAGDGAPFQNTAPAPAQLQGNAGPIDTLTVPVLPGRLTAYDVQNPVGKGGYAIVYKGIRKEDGRVVAVKKVEIFEMSQKKRERCLQEVQLLRQLSHQYIIQMLDAFIDENMLIIIFEWAPAGDLKRLIKKTAEAGRTLDEATIWSFFAQITDALRYMHQSRIMHRDIKPANVLVGANGVLKLGDLGLGRQLSEQTMEAFSKVGTPYYVSPEVVRGAGYDWKSDVWSLGCLLYELACLRSPFEMEGANLYDVFQKISKGEYAALPADQFSAPLRGLVGRMLLVDPAKRPELEEVWGITKAITEAQANTRQDVHSMSELLYTQLTMLESEVVHKLSHSNGKKVMLPMPPSEALRLLHPLSFAEPSGPVLGPDSDERQKRQLGVVMQVFAWLLKLCGKAELAASIESHLETVASQQGRRGPRPAANLVLARSNSSNNGCSQLSATGSATASPVPPPASQAAAAAVACVPVCTNLLKGAEAMKKAAASIGSSTEFAPVNALATGYGRAVCALLQGGLEKALFKVPLTARKLQHREPEQHTMAEDLNLDVDEAEQQGESILPPYKQQAIPSDEEEEAYFDEAQNAQRIASSHPSQTSSSAAPGSSGSRAAPGSSSSHSQQHSTPGRAAVAPIISSCADPHAWRAEAERLGPHLNQIRIGQLGGTAPGEPYGEWHLRWSKFKGNFKDITTDAPTLAAIVSKVHVQVSNDLDSIAAAEQRLNTNSASLLERYASVRSRHAEVAGDVQRHEELLQIGNAAISKINTQLDVLAAAMQERTATLDGSTQVKQLHDAIRKLKQEMHHMDTRIGILQHQLVRRQQQALQHTCLESALSVEDNKNCDE